MAQVQNALSEPLVISGDGLSYYLQPNAILNLSDTEYNTTTIQNLISAGSLTIVIAAGAPGEPVPHQFTNRFPVSIRSGATATELKLQFTESLGGFEDSDGNLYDAGDTFPTFTVVLVDGNGNFLLWTGLQGEDPGDGSVALTLDDDPDYFQAGLSYPATIGAGGSDYDLTDATTDDFVIYEELGGGGGSAGSPGNTITVAKSGGDFTVIQDAIDAASTGDMILVYPGTYAEDINMTANVDVIGVNKNTVIIQTSSATELITLASSSVLANITAIKAGSNAVPTIEGSGLTGVVIENCDILPTDSDSKPLHLQGCDATLKNLNVSAAFYSHIRDNTADFDVTIKNCYFTSSANRGIYLELDAETTNVLSIYNTTIKSTGQNALDAIGSNVSDLTLTLINVELDTGIDVELTNTSTFSMIDVPQNIVTVAKSRGMYTSIQDAIDSRIVQSGTAQAGAASTITLASAASSSDDTYNDMYISITAGTGYGQSNKITNYTGSSRVADVETAWSTQPDNTSQYKIVESPAVILIYPGTYVERVTCLAQINLVGIDKQNCIIKRASSPSFDFFSDCLVSNLTIDKSGSDAGETSQVYGDITNAKVENCILTTSDDAEGYAFKATKGSIEFNNCEFYGKATQAININDDDNDFDITIKNSLIDILSGNGYGIDVSVASGTPSLSIYNSIVNKGGTAARSINAGGAGISGLVFKSMAVEVNAPIDDDLFNSATTESITATSEGEAASLAVDNTLITTNGDRDLDNVTLADGYAGQLKRFLVIAEGNAADTIKITPTNLNGGTQITFSATPVGEGCTMLFDGTNWNVVSNNGGTIA